MKNDDAMHTATRTTLVTQVPCDITCGILALFFPLLLWGVGVGQESSPEDSDSVPKGFITDPSEVGGYPNYQGTPRIDSDSDGMPDEWEKQHGLDPNNPKDANHDQNRDGYTNIEAYINGLSANT